MAALDADQIRRAHAAIVSARLTDSRTALLGRVDPTVVDSLPILPTPSAQILSDLNTLNEASLLDGSTPITTWMENAAALAGGRAEAQVFLELLGQKASGSRRETLFHVPFVQNPSFVGRGDDLDALHALLQRGEAVGVRPAALTGMGGIGKTQLAVEYAYRYREVYSGGVYWVNAAEDWQAEFARLAVDVGLGAGDAPEAERRRRLALAFAEWLRARPEALVIFDNVEDPLALRSPGPGFIAEQLGCRLLFTTRRRDPDLPFASIDVRVLPEDAALALLLSSEARRGILAGVVGAEVDAAKAICRTLGYLPLAIVLAAAHLGKYPRNTVASYLGWLGKQGALAAMDAAKVDARLLATRHDAAVGATFRLSWDALKSMDARRVLQTAALLGEAVQVPKARLSLLTGLSGEAEAWCAAPLSEALGELAGLSLVEELTEQEIRLHPLVRAFAERMIEERAAFAAACAERVCEALWDMGRLHDEVAARGVDAVLGDLRAGIGLSGGGGKGRFERLIRPLDREAHCLRGWDPAKQPGFLLQQLRNRCFEMDFEDVERRCEATLEERAWPYLRERIRTSRESEALVRTLEGHADSVSGVAATADGRHAVSASWDRTLKVWDLSTGQAIRALEGHTGRVNSVTVTTDGRHVISASDDNTLKVWDLSTGRAVRTLKGHTGRVNGVVVTADGRHALSASADRTVKVWELSSGHPVRTLIGHTDEVTCIAVTPDGCYAVSASRFNTMKVWDLSTGQELRTLVGHASRVASIAVTADGRHVVSASLDDTLKVWDLSTGRVIRTIEGHSMRMTGVAVTSDGQNAVSVSYDNTLKVWDLPRGQAVRTLNGHTAPVNSVAVTVDGRYVISASSDRTLKVWDLLSGQADRTLEGHANMVNGVAVTADGRHAVTASWDRTLRVWDLPSGQAVHVLEGHTAMVIGVAVTSDGHHAVSASSDNTLKVWDLPSGQAGRTLGGHTAPVIGVAVTTDGRHVVSASYDCTLKVWDLSSVQIVRTLEGHTAGVNGVAVTAIGQHAVSAARDNTLKVWDLTTGVAVRTLNGHTSSVNGVAVTVDGCYAVSASYDRTLRVWDLSSGQMVRTLEGHTASVRGVAVMPDACHAVSASLDRMLKVWDLSTGESIVTLETQAPLHCCAVTPDGKIILTGDSLGAVHILDWIHP